MSKKPKTKKSDIEKMKGTMKFEVAQELGLLEKIKSVGWKGLTAQETGKIGGLITKKKKEKIK